MIHKNVRLAFTKASLHNVVRFNGTIGIFTHLGLVTLQSQICKRNENVYGFY